MARLVGVVLMALLSTACSAHTDIYHIDKVVVHDVIHSPQDSENIHVVYSTINESLYYCPGVNLERKGTSAYLDFIRSPIKKRVEPAISSMPYDDWLSSSDHKVNAQVNPDEAVGAVEVVTIPSEGLNELYIRDKNSQKCIWTSPGAPR